MKAYLDHAATTHVRPEAAAAFASWVDQVGNPSSAHLAGQHTRVAVEQAREQIARVLDADPGDVVFTASGTEADNLALKGLVWAADRARRHVVTTAVEHPAVLNTARWLAERGEIDLTVVDPERDGSVAVDRVLEAVRDDTLLVSVMAANNVTGAVNDVAALGTALADRPAVLHVDAVQAFATRDVSMSAWRADAIALSAHKIGGPVGVGVAGLRRGVPVMPLLHGGGQERAVRSGTMTAALDAACAVAFVAAADTRAATAEHTRALTDRLWRGLRGLGGMTRLGPDDADRRLASHLAVVVDDVEADGLVFALDRGGVAASAGSACASGATAGNHVLEAMGVGDGALLRLTVGATTTRNEVEYALDVLSDAIPALRAG